MLFTKWLPAQGSKSVRRAEFLPGDLVRMTITDKVCQEFNTRSGVVTHGPDDQGGWLVSSAPGSIRCVAEELTMITPREER